MPALIRWLRFNIVGLAGIGVQLATLWVLADLLEVHYVLATIAAVESAVVHNFAWHVRWTWRDRAGASAGPLWLQLVRFNLANGAVSLAGNTLLMIVLVGAVHLHHVPASAISIAACSLVNFALADRWVFASVPSE